MTLLPCMAMCLRFDGNNDGVLDASEQENFAEAFGAEYKDAILTQLSEADENLDGNVDPTELARFLVAETESDDDDEAEAGSAKKEEQAPRRGFTTVE